MIMKETKELLTLIFKFIGALESSLADGKFSATDLWYFRSVLPLVNKGIEGINKIPGEIKALDEQGRAELIEFIKKEFEIEDDKLEKFVEECIETFLRLLFLVADLRSRKKKTSK